MVIPRDCRLRETIPVPTEFVVYSPKLCTPKYARVYNVSKWIVNGEILDYKTLSSTRHFKGTYSHDEIILVEVWSNYGDDGHTHYRHVGYRYVPESLYEKEIKYNIPFYAGYLPYCMSFIDLNEDYPIERWKDDKKFIEEHGVNAYKKPWE
jgi:hypothetical protein